MRGVLIAAAEPADAPVPVSAMAEFDLDRPWALAEQVSLRPEPFGALAYHFGTRRLSFVKDRQLLAVVEALAAHPSARAACDAVGVAQRRRPAVTRALATLARSRMITERR